MNMEELGLTCRIYLHSKEFRCQQARITQVLMLLEGQHAAKVPFLDRGK